MKFLQKNYEKVILIVLFVIFIFTLIQLTRATDKNAANKQVELPKREPDYQVADQTSDEFDLQKIFGSNRSWNATAARNEKSGKNYSDLTQMFKAVRCGHADCGKIIPYEVILNGANCPMCNKQLVKFTPVEDETGRRLLDTDRDGIPDLVEQRAELNPNSARDRLRDKDGDGFVNLYEYRQKTDIKDPMSHPPFHIGLGVNRVERQLLRMRLKAVEETSSPKTDWTIQIAVYPRVKDGKLIGREKNQYKVIGDSYQVGSGRKAIRYTIKDVEFVGNKEVKLKSDDGSIKTVIERIYKVVVVDDRNREIAMILNEDVYDPDDMIYFDYVVDVDRKERSGIVGDTLQFGNKTTGITEYVIKSLDKKRLAVVLVDAADESATPIEITRNIVLPKQFWPQKDVTENNDNQNDMNMMVPIN